MIPHHPPNLGALLDPEQPRLQQQQEQGYVSVASPEVRTKAILEGHADEVWILEWSHSGDYLASASRDKTAIIWRIGPKRECSEELTLRDHPYPVGCIAWSLDDSILLTGCENLIKLWDTKTGLCIRTLDSHTDSVTALQWLPDDSGFISGGMGGKINIRDAEGNQRYSWSTAPRRITDLEVSPDLTRIIALEMNHLSQIPPSQPTSGSFPSVGGGAESRNDVKSEHMILVYDWETKQTQSSIQLNGELTSVRISSDSKFALVNCSPNKIYLWDITLKQEVSTLTGQHQSKHVIRSSFGGKDDGFVVSGSEDGNVYLWHRNTGTLLQVLSGHGTGSVNSVVWSPKNERMFASCSDDKTIRIWEVGSPEIMLAATSRKVEPEE